jgi:6-phosphogluconolactonase/glucosamine-6-phosphate isomerase/deaminase
VTEVWVVEKQSWRISFTFPLINNAGSIVFLVTGKEKATVLAMDHYKGENKTSIACPDGKTFKRNCVLDTG